jgi:AcrR family transcriptional regulator
MDADARTAILATAKELFASRGYRAVTMDEIAQRRGMSKRTLYKHFQSKEEIAAEVVAGMLAGLAPVVDSAMTAGGGFAETFDRVMNGIEAFLRFAPMIFLEDLERDAPQVFARITEFRALQMRRYAELLRAAQARGEAPGDLDASLAVDVLIAAVQGAGRPEWLRAHGIGLHELIGVLKRVFLYGVMGSAAGKGERRGD